MDQRQVELASDELRRQQFVCSCTNCFKRITMPYGIFCDTCYESQGIKCGCADVRAGKGK